MFLQIYEWVKLKLIYFTDFVSKGQTTIHLAELDKGQTVSIQRQVNTSAKFDFNRVLPYKSTKQYIPVVLCLC